MVNSILGLGLAAAAAREAILALQLVMEVLLLVGPLLLQAVLQAQTHKPQAISKFIQAHLKEPMVMLVH